MTSSTWQIKEAVQHVLDDLPAEKIEEVLEFALFLKARWTAHRRVKGDGPGDLRHWSCTHYRLHTSIG